MHESLPVTLIGATASPYTQKMVALLRYRRIPYAIRWGSVESVCDGLGVERPRPVLMPTFLFAEADGLEAVVDSTPIIRRLEFEYEGRSALPTDPALAFIDYLLEDFADEWCTKYMFHYRWYFKDDADNAGSILPLCLDVSLGEEPWQNFKAAFSTRQIDRLYVVGSNKDTAPLIDASYRRFLRALEAHLANQHFMLGSRPGAGDFALYGQLSQLIGFDPTPREIAHDESPRAVAWVTRTADLGGLEPTGSDWCALEQQPESLKGLLREIGRVFAPVQIANATAAREGKKAWECEIDGVVWQQQTFPYQAKTLRWTRDQYQSLSVVDKARVDRYLAGTGVEAMLA